MTGKAIYRHMLICDGACGATFGENAEYATAAESRRAAGMAGWKLVPKIKANGKPAAMRDPGKAHNACDVCPACLPTFQPPGTGRPAGGEAWWTQRIRRLEEENARLRGRQ